LIGNRLELLNSMPLVIGQPKWFSRRFIIVF